MTLNLNIVLPILIIFISSIMLRICNTIKTDEITGEPSTLFHTTINASNAARRFKRQYGVDTHTQAWQRIYFFTVKISKAFGNNALLWAAKEMISIGMKGNMSKSYVYGYGRCGYGRYGGYGGYGGYYGGYPNLASMSLQMQPIYYYVPVSAGQGQTFPIDGINDFTGNFGGGALSNQQLLEQLILIIQQAIDDTYQYYNANGNDGGGTDGGGTDGGGTDGGGAPIVEPENSAVVQGAKKTKVQPIVPKRGTNTKTTVKVTKLEETVTESGTKVKEETKGTKIEKGEGKELEIQDSVGNNSTNANKTVIESKDDGFISEGNFSGASSPFKVSETGGTPFNNITRDTLINEKNETTKSPS